MIRLKIAIVVLLIVFCSQRMSGQKDSLPPPTMTSNRLITLDDYNPDAAYGTSYLEMMKMTPEAKKRKTIFNRRGSKFILPSLFIAYGTAARFNQLPIRQFDYDIEHEINKRVDRTYGIDDYFEYGMPVLAYGLGFIPGVAEHNFRDRTLVMATSFIVMKGSVELLKYAVPVDRPRGDNRSFPSGHTAVTFWSAHIMYKEYKGCSSWIGVGGYLVATTTGALRIMNNAHWLSDVVMGAGIGLLSAEIGYMMLPVWHSIFGIKDGGKRFAAVPTFGTQGVGLGLVYQF